MEWSRLPAADEAAAAPTSDPQYGAANGDRHVWEPGTFFHSVEGNATARKGLIANLRRTLGYLLCCVYHTQFSAVPARCRTSIRGSGLRLARSGAPVLDRKREVEGRIHAQYRIHRKEGFLYV